MVSTFDEWQSSKMKKRSAWEEHQVNTGLDPEVTSRYAQKNHKLGPNSRLRFERLCKMADDELWRIYIVKQRRLAL